MSLNYWTCTCGKNKTDLVIGRLVMLSSPGRRRRRAPARVRAFAHFCKKKQRQRRHPQGLPRFPSSTTECVGGEGRWRRRRVEMGSHVTSHHIHTTPHVSSRVVLRIHIYALISNFKDFNAMDSEILSLVADAEARGCARLLLSVWSILG